MRAEAPLSLPVLPVSVLAVPVVVLLASAALDPGVNHRRAFRMLKSMGGFGSPRAEYHSTAAAVKERRVLYKK